MLAAVILGSIGFVFCTIAAYGAFKNEKPYLGVGMLILAVVGLLGFILGSKNSEAESIEEKTVVVAEVQVDTVITVKGDLRDTTYVIHYED